MRDRKFVSMVKKDKAAFAGRLVKDDLAEQKKEALIQLAAEKDIVYRPGMMRMFLLQLRYMGAAEYGLQALGFLGVLALTVCLWRQGVFTGYQLLGVAALWIIFSTVCFVSGLTMTFSNHMGELEAVCYFNLGQLVCMKLIWGGAGQICALAVFGVFFAKSIALPVMTIGMYLALVWLLANTVYFLVFAVVRGKGQLLALAAAALLLSFCAWLPLIWEELFFAFSAGVCAVFFMICLPVLAGELVYVFRGIEKGELLCFD